MSIVVSIPACHAGDPGSILGNGAIKLVDPTKTCTQANDTTVKGLLSNIRHRYHETC